MLRIQNDITCLSSTLYPRLDGVAAHASPLADQLRRALIAIALNTAEGAGASGGNKRRAYRIALGESRELQAGLQLAEALGFLTLTERERDQLDKVGRTLHKLARPTR